MSLRLRWIVTLASLITLTTGMVFFIHTLERTMRTSAQATILQREIRGLQQNIAQVRAELPHVAQWRELAERTRQAGLDPKKWRTYPVSITRDLPWEELAGVILIASNALPRPSEYWFQPTMLRVVRAEQAPAENQPAQPLQNKNQEPERYSLDFEGHFFIPERNQP